MPTTTRAVRREANWVEKGSRALRRMPPTLVRVLIGLDTIAAVIPLWFVFWHWRWTQRRLTVRGYAKLYVHTVKFMAVHAVHSGEGTGALNVDWFSGPIRHANAREVSHHQPKGSCGSCQKCCHTTWLPEGERLSCTFLGAQGCTIYGGLYWDYFNCGRYPAKPIQVAAYGCPRFEGILRGPVPVAKPKLLPLAPAAAAEAA